MPKVLGSVNRPFAAWLDRADARLDDVSDLNADHGSQNCESSDLAGWECLDET